MRAALRLAQQLHAREHAAPADDDPNAGRGD
jgi:hypothetical protein